ncbi:MAG: flagellar basal-body MS-ring/collar protein FliF [Nitrospiria bacterium]
MADTIQQLTQSLTSNGFMKKIGLLVFLIASLSGLVVVWLWAQKPEMEVLYSNLTSEDAGAIVAKLKEAHIPYTFSADGSAVLVPSDKVHELRIQMATQGIPQGGVIGFEIFDRTTIGTTEFVQKINYRRALEGELDRTIGQLSEVSRARVHLAVPEKTLFTERQEQPRASVVVSLRSGRNLSEGQIQGIVHLVSSSVESLAPQAVTVVDNHGRILSKNSDDSSKFQMSASQLDYQHSLEKKIEENIQSLLEKVVGPNKAIVRVSGLLDFRQVEKTEEKYDPDGQVVRSEQKTDEKQSGSSTAPGTSGVPGVLSNTPAKAPATPNEGAKSNNSTQKQNDVTNYEISKTVSRIFEPSGAIKRLSVAVMVDGAYEITKGDKGENSRKYIPRSEDEMKKLEELVKKAMGYSDERKDQVEVVNIPFEANAEVPVEESAPKETENKFAQYSPYIRYVLGGVVSLIVFFLVIRPVLKGLASPSQSEFPAVQMNTGQMAAVGEAYQQQQQGLPGLPTREQVTQMAKQNPQLVAQVVKGWLREK